jgi:hypothetical protein
MEGKEKDQPKKEGDCEVKEVKIGILSKKDHKKKRKSVNWDIKNLEENELQNKLHPVTMKITEPKTPYTPYEEGDDEYFNKLNEVNKTKPTEDVLAQVINTLEKIPEKKNDEEEYMEIEVIEKDGTKTKKLVKRENKENKEFQAKKKKAYHNEFAIAKEFMLKHKDEDNDEELIKKTMENTLANKYVGLIENQKIEKDKENDK